MREPGRRSTGRVLLAIGATLATLLLAEVGLRAFGDRLWHRPFLGEWPFVETDPYLGWRNRPGYADAHLRIDGRGLREPVVSASPGPGRVRVRVVCLGDSGTFGVARTGRDDAYAVANYPEALGRVLAHRGRSDVEVLNAGVLGYTSAHGLRQLRATLLDLAPDVVTVRFGFNDHAPAWAPGRSAAEPRARWRRALLHGLASTGLGRLLLFVRADAEVDVAALGGHAWMDGAAFERNLHRFVEVARDGGARLAFLDYPLRAPGRGRLDPEDLLLLGARNEAALRQRHEAFQQRVAAVAAATGTPLVRTRDACRRAPEPCFSEHDLLHPSRAGHERIARRLATRLERLGWLEPRPAR